MSIVIAYFLGLVTIITLISLLWVLSLVMKNASIIDIFWGLGFVIVGWLFFVFTDGLVARKLLLMILVSIWGLRLTLYLAYRNIGKGEDFRYARWRADAGGSWWWQSYFRVFLLQGMIMWLVSMPLLGGQTSGGGLSVLDFLAVLLWMVGFIFEMVGDWQLARFKANPRTKGTVLKTGLWRYTRHPNYFGDAVQWWAFYLIALSAGAWWTVVSPLLMTFFLMRVSGVVMLEKTLTKSKPEYADYIRKTSAFFPLPPRRS